MRKTYPKTVVLRKNLAVGIILVSIVIVALIMHNIYRAAPSNKPALNQPQNKAIQQTVSQADTNWFQTQKSQVHVSKPTRVENLSTALRQLPTSLLPSAMAEGVHTSLLQQEYQRAIAAPISANQIVLERSASETLPGSVQKNNGFMIPMSNANEDADQNMQAKKKAFLTAQQQDADNDYLNTQLKNPRSRYEVQAGTIIPGVLVTGINSDLPGDIIAQVRSNVYDSIAGKYLLIPQGAKLTGQYDSQVAYGQERVLIAWQRIIFPNGQSISLRGMPGIDLSGYSGFKDQVNNHYGKIFGSVLLLSILSAGAQLSQTHQVNDLQAAPSVGQTIAQSLGANIANTGTMLTQKNINIQPTLEIRPGYIFNIIVTKDMVFPGGYSESL